MPNIRVIEPEHVVIEQLKAKLRSVLYSRPEHWLSPAERAWKLELKAEDSITLSPPHPCDEDWKYIYGVGLDG